MSEVRCYVVLTGDLLDNYANLSDNYDDLLQSYVNLKDDYVYLLDPYVDLLGKYDVNWMAQIGHGHVLVMNF